MRRDQLLSLPEGPPYAGEAVMRELASEFPDNRDGGNGFNFCPVPRCEPDDWMNTGGVFYRRTHDGRGMVLGFRAGEAPTTVQEARCLLITTSLSEARRLVTEALGERDMMVDFCFRETGN